MLKRRQTLKLPAALFRSWHLSSCCCSVLWNGDDGTNSSAAVGLVAASSPVSITAASSSYNSAAASSSSASSHRASPLSFSTTAAGISSKKRPSMKNATALQRSILRCVYRLSTTGAPGAGPSSPRWVPLELVYQMLSRAETKQLEEASSGAATVDGDHRLNGLVGDPFLRSRYEVKKIVPSPLSSSVDFASENNNSYRSYQQHDNNYDDEQQQQQQQPPPPPMWHVRMLPVDQKLAELAFEASKAVLQEEARFKASRQQHDHDGDARRGYEDDDDGGGGADEIYDDAAAALSGAATAVLLPIDVRSLELPVALRSYAMNKFGRSLARALHEAEEAIPDICWTLEGFEEQEEEEQHGGTRDTTRQHRFSAAAAELVLVSSLEPVAPVTLPLPPPPDPKPLPGEAKRKQQERDLETRKRRKGYDNLEIPTGDTPHGAFLLADEIAAGDLINQEYAMNMSRFSRAKKNRRLWRTIKKRNTDTHNSSIITIDHLAHYIPSFFIPLDVAVEPLKEQGYSADHLRHYFGRVSALQIVSLPLDEYGRTINNNNNIDAGNDRSSRNNNNMHQQQDTTTRFYTRIHGHYAELDMEPIFETNRRFAQYEVDPKLAEPFLKVLRSAKGHAPRHHHHKQQQRQPPQAQSDTWMPLRTLLEKAGPEAEAALPYQGPEALLYFAQMQHLFNFSPRHGMMVSLRTPGVSSLFFKNSPCPLFFDRLWDRLFHAGATLSETARTSRRASVSTFPLTFRSLFFPEELEQLDRFFPNHARHRHRDKLSSRNSAVNNNNTNNTNNSSGNNHRDDDDDVYDDGGTSGIQDFAKAHHEHFYYDSQEHTIMLRKTFEKLKAQKLSYEEQLAIALREQRHNYRLKDHIHYLQRKIQEERDPTNPLLDEKELAHAVYSALPSVPGKYLTIRQLRHEMPQEYMEFLPICLIKFLRKHDNLFKVFYPVIGVKAVMRAEFNVPQSSASMDRMSSDEVAALIAVLISQHGSFGRLRVDDIRRRLHERVHSHFTSTAQLVHFLHKFPESFSIIGASSEMVTTAMVVLLPNAKILPVMAAQQQQQRQKVKVGGQQYDEDDDEDSYGGEE